ncbi:hypothetical protein [Nonomuraea sp. NPDC048826]|uniref:hypothetical protein n=1 Tax=Nonomuraea sp. NPDC048826 TaxID=3364347 RepID=UPI00371CE78B
MSRMSTKAARCAAVLAAGVIPLLAAATPATPAAAESAAGRNVSARTGGVYGAFHHRGDDLQLWDTRCSDRHAVYIKVWNGAGTKTYWNKSCGTRWIKKVNYREGRDIAIQVCVSRTGVDPCSPRRWGVA